MALKEYVDELGHTFLYDEDDKLRPKDVKLVGSKATKAPENKSVDSTPATK
jgi:hypothetical protein